ncbi:MAG: ABC transporter permease [Spirochaetes bacterium]|nr:ABC transporter permease [Spirochaetota bacterium]
MLGKILPFEIKFLHKNFFTYLIYLAMMFQGIWYMKGFNDYYKSDDSLMNSAGTMYILLCTIGMILMIVFSIITGTTLYRDLKNKTDQYFYTLPVNEKKFFMSRFTASFVINIIFSLVYFAGCIISKYTGIAPPDRFGPTQWMQIIHGYLLFALPNVFILTTAAYSALVFFRKMAPSYLAIFFVSLLWIIMEGVSHTASDLFLIKIIDPFGYVYVKDLVDAMGAMQRNTAFLTIDYVYFINRFIWVGAGILLLVISRKKFTFKYFFGGESKKVKSVNNSDSASFSFLKQHIKIPEVSLTYSLKEYLKKAARLTVLEFKNVTRPVSFKIIIGIMAVMFILYNLLFNPTYYIGSALPVTTNMTLTRLQINFMLIIIIIIWANELFFKEKTVDVWQITDSVPLPSWVTLASKFIAMCGVVLIFGLTLIACGLFAQLVQGFTDFNCLLYINDALGYRWGWLTYVLFVMFTLFIGGLTGRRYATTILSVGYFIIMIISFDLGISEEIRFGFGLVPGIEGTYSELNGYGMFDAAAAKYFLMWAILSVALLIAGMGLWARGTGKSILKRTVSGIRSNPAALIIIAACIFGFFFMQGYIKKNVNENRNFISEKQTDEESALYEKKYGHLSELTQPKIRHVDLEVDLFPENRKYVYRAVLEVVNRSKEKIDTLYLNIDYRSKVEKISINNKALLKETDDDILGMESYKLTESINGFDKAVLYIEGSKQYTGFSQEDFQADLAFNGLFIERVIPVIGYNAGRELTENKKRKEHGLEKLKSRMSSVTDTNALRTSYAAGDALMVSGRTTVSTTLSQYAYAPGELVKIREEDNRNYFQYSVSKENPFYWHIGSGKFKQFEKVISGKKVKILYDPKHYFYIDKYITFVSSSLEYIERNLGPFPHKELRIIEIPHYQDEFYSFANTIAISEKEGWYANMKEKDVEAYVHFCLAREMIRQWLHSKAGTADVQGAEMILTAIPEALALNHIKNQYGKEQLDIILTKKRKDYIKGRGDEPNVQPPLLYADGVDYLEQNKGTLAVFHLMQQTGSKQFHKLLNTWISSSGDNYLVFKDFYSLLETENLLGTDEKELFETVQRDLKI